MRNALMFAVACAAACGRTPVPGATTRDSAGVAIVETPAAWLAQVPVRTIVDPPVVQIGTIAGRAEEQFSDIEAVRLLPDGRLTVADRGSAEIRFFRTDGHFVASTGGAGEAPGEYRFLTGLGTGPGDSLWAYDFGLRRLSVLTTTGAVARTVSVGPTLSAPTAVGRLAGGGFVLQEQWSSGLGAVARTGLVRDAAAVALLAADGARLDTITLVPGREVFVGSEDGRAVMSAPLLAHHAVVATTDALVFVGDQTAFEIRTYAPSGTLLRIVRVTDLDLSTSPEWLARAAEARVREAPPDERTRLRARLEAMPAPATRPAFGPLLVDDAGNLWVGSHEAAGPPRAWTVFAPAGGPLAVVRVPPRFAVREVAGGLVIGTWRDSLDVEYVRAYGAAGLLPETPAVDPP